MTRQGGVPRAAADVRQTVALDGLDLTIEPGELVALLGPSGCGKTTALRCVAGFERPDSGRRARRRQGHHRRARPTSATRAWSSSPTPLPQPQRPRQRRLRPAGPQGAGGRARHARADELLELVGLPTHADRYPHQLSGGQQQRVALARALALEPRVLLLDEPLSALDAKVRVALREEIRRLQLDLGITTIFVTHDQEEALSIADRVAVLRDGRLEQVRRARRGVRPAGHAVRGRVRRHHEPPGRAGLVGRHAVTVLGQHPAGGRARPRRLLRGGRARSAPRPCWSPPPPTARPRSWSRRSAARPSGCGVPLGGRRGPRRRAGPRGDAARRPARG